MNKNLRAKRDLVDLENWFKDFITVVFLALFAFVISLWTFKETLEGLFTNKIPLAGDGLLAGLYIKLVEQSSYVSLFLQNINTNQFGWPGKLDFTSYPVGNTQEMLLIKVFMDLTGINDPSQIIHIFSVLKASPIAISVYILARILGINRILSFCVGIVFALNSFNLVRAEGHFLLALTWSLPLGLVAIYVAFKQVYRSEQISRNKIFVITLFSGLSFMSGYYYSFFLIIFSFISFIFLLILINLNSSAQTVLNRAKNSITRLLLPIYSLAIFVLGLLIQTLPILLRNRSISNLTGLADRSPTEAIIYAGTPESLLFDFYSFGLQLLNRPDLVAYLQSRISWEGSQVGALSGAFLIIVLTFVLVHGLLQLMKIRLRSSNQRFKLDSSSTFVILILFSTLLLYFVSPINYLISIIIPQIRAWGRLSVVISLLTLLWFGLLLSRQKKFDPIVWPIIVLLIFIPSFEVKQFNMNRPTSSSLNNSTESQFKNFKLALKELEAMYPKNCSLVNLPIYPFPEFDMANDKNIDYGQLQLPMIDTGYFRWSYAGVKATENFAAWQSLISEFPPFTRANLGVQVDYAKSLGACGVLIDRSFLTQVENLDLGLILKERSSCVSKLNEGSEDTGGRFVSINFRKGACRISTNPKSNPTVNDPTIKKLIWRIDQSSELGFNGLFQTFPSTSAINLRLWADQNNTHREYKLVIRIFSDEQLEDSQFTLLITDLRSGEFQSFVIKPNSQGVATIQLPPKFLTGKVEKFSATLTSIGKSEFSSWAVRVD